MTEYPNSGRKLWSHKGYSKHGKMDNDKVRVHSRSGFGEWKKNEKGSEISTKQRLNGRTFKELLRLRARKANTPGSTIERKDKLPQEDRNDTEVNFDTSLKEGATETGQNVEAEDGQANHDTSRFVETGQNVEAEDGQANHGTSRFVETGQNVEAEDGQANHGTSRFVETGQNVEAEDGQANHGTTRFVETGQNVEAEDGQANHGTSRFVEYWVPVQLSDVQREQYCASLLSNSMVLGSYSRSESAQSLHDIVISSRKCCDHPYLVDPSIRSSVIDGVPTADQLDAEIEISGKLQLLDKILLEIKKRGLRVLIIFQKLGGSGFVTIGDILADFIHQKYGTDSYARIDGDISRSKKRDAAEKFNNKDGGTFVCLIETRECHRSIKLLFVDTIIFFDSDWDPLNDLRAVQKISIDSQFEKLKIFRLYSCCTVEEKVLLLAKQGMTVDSTFRYIKHTTCQKLLTWGACYQFGKQNCNEDGLCSNSFSRQKIFEDVLRELSALLPNISGDVDNTNFSVISEVHQSGETYTCKNSLLGELETQLMDNFPIVCQLIENEPPHNFWRNLLQGRRLSCKYLRDQSRNIRRKVQFLGDCSEEPELDEPTKKKFRKETDDTGEDTPLISKLRSKQKLHAQSKKRKFAGVSRLLDRRKSDSISIQCQQRKVATSGEHDGDDSGSSNATRCGGEPTQADSPITELLSTQSQDNSLPLHQEPDLARPLGCSVQGRDISLSLQPRASIPINGSNRESSVPDCTSTYLDRERKNHVESSPMATEVAHPTCSDPLQMEIDKIQRDQEQATKLHEELKLQFQSECEKEILEIQKKYDLLLQKADMEFQQKKQYLDTCYNKIYENKFLAGAMLEKHTTAYAAGSERTQTVTISAFMEEMSELYLTPAAPMSIPRPAAPAAERSPTISPVTTPPRANSVQVMNNPSRPPNAELQVETRSSTATMSLIHDQSSASPEATERSSIIRAPPLPPVLSAGHQGQLCIPTISYSGNHQVRREVRVMAPAPAPHLRNTTRPPGVFTSSTGSLPIPTPVLRSASQMPIKFQDC